MMEKSSLIFCAGSLAVCLLLSARFVPLASISDAQLAKAKSVMPAEEMGAVDLGDFGEVTVLDMATYYMENPPVVKAGVTKKVRFEGC